MRKNNRNNFKENSHPQAQEISMKPEKNYIFELVVSSPR